MSKKIIFSIDLEKEPDFLGNKAKVNLLGVNQLFRPSKKGTLKLTEEGRKYKAFLKSKVKKIREDLNLKKAIDYPIMVYVRIYHTVKLKNNGKKDERYTRDVDNLFKPLQDALEGKDGIWSNDKKIRFITWNIRENEKEGNSFQISILPLEEKKIQRIEKIFF